MSRRRKPTVWEALNEPIIHITEQQAKNVFLASIVIAMAAWVAPYWGEAGTAVAYYAPENVFEKMASVGDVHGGSARVAGASIAAGYESSVSSSAFTPDWYYVAAEMPDALVESLALGANQVLDISGPITEMTGFYEPGVSAVWNAWLDLMVDP